jgi:sec-independent protein translocase protein TatB
LQRDVDKALDIEGVDKPAAPPAAVEEAQASNESSVEVVPVPTTPEAPKPETFVEAEAHQAANEPLAIVREVPPEPASTPDPATEADESRLKDAKAS